MKRAISVLSRCCASAWVKVWSGPLDDLKSEIRVLLHAARAATEVLFNHVKPTVIPTEDEQ